MQHHDIKAVKSAANGRWHEIIPHFTGLPSDYFPVGGTTKERDCPSCGGNTRFRFSDMDGDGSCFCNHCHLKQGDGFAVLVALQEKDLSGVINSVGDYLGCKPLPKKIDPAKHLEFRDWIEAGVKVWCVGKPPITPDAVKELGGRRARYRGQPVIAIPVRDKSLSECGWIIYAAGGGKIPKFTKDKPPEYVNVKLTAGSKAGLVAPIERFRQATTIIKCEGPPDAMAFNSVCDNKSICAITNSNGATENPQGWILEMCQGKTVYVVGDADQPGVQGAKAWCFRLHGHCESVAQVELPYPVEETKGKDLRDWLLEGNTAQDFMRLAESADKYEPETTKEGLKLHTEDDFPLASKRLAQLGITVLYESDRDEITCYSRHQRKTFIVKDIERVSVARLIQWCGGQVKYSVVSEPSTEEEMTVQDVKESIALVAASLRSDRVQECGQGVWIGRDPLVGENDSVVLVGKGEAARFNCTFERLFEPRIDGLVLDMSNQIEWYDFDVLAALIEKAKDLDWRQSVFDRTVKIFSEWHYSREDDSELIVGLVFATWVQSVWNWRPQVSISGPSKSGKSEMFRILETIFGKLSWKKEKLTEAGIRQSVRRDSRVIMIDEFEDDKNRQRILNLLRTSSRGGSVVRGTTHQKAEEYGLRHIAWVAAIETGLTETADANRFIDFELMIPPKSKWKKFRFPADQEIRELGMSILACSVFCCHQAVEISEKLLEQKLGVDGRLAECYAAPISMLSAVTGQSDRASEFLVQFIGQRSEDDGSPESDETELLSEILGCIVDLGHGRKKTVGQCLESYADTQDSEIRSRLETIGVKIFENKGLFFVHKTLRKQIGRQGRIDQILKRIRGATRQHAKVGGVTCRGILVPKDELFKLGVDLNTQIF